MAPLLRPDSVRMAPVAGLAVLVLALAATLPRVARAGGEGYPTRTCVERKLQTAAKVCRKAMEAVALHRLGAGASDLDRRLAGLRRILGRRFALAEQRSEAAGAECRETTADADAVFDALVAGAGAVVDEVLSEEPAPGKRGRSCRMGRVAAAARTCARLLGSEARQVGRPEEDPLREKLASRRSHALAAFEAAYGAAGCPAPAHAEDVRRRVEELVRNTLLAHVVSPAVPAQWTEMVPAPVEYQGELLEPLCSRGTAYRFWVRRGDPGNNNLLVYYQGGGACWNFGTCVSLPVYKQEANSDENPDNFPHGFNDPTRSPFRGWNAIVVPYCTGDVHWGAEDHLYVTPDGRQQEVIFHRGRINAAVVEKWAREHFVSPDRVFVTGSSAGAYGAAMNGVYLKEMAYPSSEFAILGDAGNGVITPDFLANHIGNWGIERTMPAWIPELDVPITELDAADLWISAARTYPNDRFGTYTTAFDGGTGGQTGFYNIMRNLSDITAWFRWWESSCEWNRLMLELNQRAAENAPNYRYYVGAGSRHTMFGSDRVYTDTTGNVPTIDSWVRAMIAGTPDWQNVLCDDCSLVLPGDPRPDPLRPPFFQVGPEVRILCDLEE